MMMMSALCQTNTFMFDRYSAQLIEITLHVCTCRHTRTLYLISSQPVFALSPQYCVFSGQATNINFIVFGQTLPGVEPTIYRNRGEQANQYTTDGVKCSTSGELCICFVQHKRFFLILEKLGLSSIFYMQGTSGDQVTFHSTF